MTRTFPMKRPSVLPRVHERQCDGAVTWPVEVWFGGSRTFTATLDFGGRPVVGVLLDPQCRFLDQNAADTVWPRQEPNPCARRNQGG